MIMFVGWLVVGLFVGLSHCQIRGTFPSTSNFIGSLDMSDADWEERYSKTHKRFYFYNTVSNVSSWTDPRTGAQDAVVNPSTAVVSTSAASTAAAVAAPTTTAMNGAPTISSSSNLEPDRKRSRHDETISADVVTSSYQPPVSGAAVDMKVIAEKKLNFPIIIPSLGPAPRQTTMWDRPDIQVNPFLAQTYRDGMIVDRNGVQQKFKDITNPLQGRHIYNLIRRNNFSRTLEVGLAMGASASWITQAHKELGLEGKHYAIDPNQTEQYDDMGLYLVEKCGNLSHLTLMKMTSYRALPLLFEQVLRNEIPKFDLIYIDGWHTFDYTLVDFFYADLLLNVHGVIVLDDIKHLPVKRCFDYIVKNYTHYQLVQQTPVYNPSNPDQDSSQATFVKVGVDQRTWNAHVNF
jgi:predicted O-methyltransferase YrrM